MRSRLVLLALVALLQSTASHGETYLQIDSEPGDPVGNGEQLTFADESIFTLLVEADNGVRARVLMPTPINGSYYWTVRLYAAGDRPLVPGPYEDARLRESPSDTRTVPTMEVRGPFASCDSVEGRFDLLDIGFDASGNLVRLAADVEQRCDGSAATLRASIRVNAEPPFEPPPDTDGDGVFDSVDNCVDTVNPEQADADADLLGDRCDDRFSRTLIAGRWKSGSLLDFPEQTVIDVFEPTQGTFEARRVGSGIRVRYDGDAFFYLRFGGVGAELLSPGVYEDATSDGEDGSPRFDTSGWAVCNDSGARFEVHELELAADNTVLAFSADFALRCGSFVGGSMIGGVRYQASDAAPGLEDFDEDGVPDIVDNCRGATNPRQGDADGDFVGDVCDEKLGATFVLIDSPPGDWVGRGLRQLFHNGRDTVSPNWSRRYGVRFGGLDNELGRYGVELHGYSVPAGSTRIEPGHYENIARAPFQEDDEIGFSIGGAGRSCGNVTGAVDVHEADYGPSNIVRRFSAGFEVLCSGATLPLRGSMHYDAQFRPAPGDGDGDGVLDAEDNCPETPDPTQADGNADGRGDVCTLVAIDVAPRRPFDATWILGWRPVDVAVFGSEAVDVRDLIADELAFGPLRARPASPPRQRDIDGDGFHDLLVDFDPRETGIAVGDPRACLSGNLAGQYFLACDALRAYPPGCGRGAGLAILTPVLPWLWRRRRGSAG